MKFTFPSFKLWHDLGISALLLLGTTGTFLWLTGWAVVNDKLDSIKEFDAVLGVLIMRFWEGYQQKRREELRNGNEKPPAKMPPSA
mgnify:CR=1 FL=1